MISSRQKTVALNLTVLRAYVRKLRAALRLNRRDFNVSFVSDSEIERLNRAYRGKPEPTDVLSFPWNGREEGSAKRRQAGAKSARLRKARSRSHGSRSDRTAPDREFKNFLGDIVISAEAAKRNARVEGHSTHHEVRWLILHGVLHLLGYDHAADCGEMTSLEYSLRERLAN